MLSKGFVFPWLLALSTAAGLFAGCDETVNFSNDPPGAVTIEGDLCYIATEGTIQLTCSSTDPNGDPVTFKWTATGGTFSPTDEGESVTWEAPYTPGVYYVTATASDGIASRSGSIQINVGEVVTEVIGSVYLQDSGYSYFLSGNDPLVIESGNTLRIEAGVKIVVDQPTGGLQVEGTLLVEGTNDDKVIFQPNACPDETGSWQGIKFVGAQASGTLRHCNIVSANKGVWAIDGASVDMDTCLVDVGLDVGVSVEEAATINITGGKIWDNAGGGVLVRNGFLTVDNASVRYNTNFGIRLIAELINSPFGAEVTGSVIANNSPFGFYLSEYAYPFINGNSLFFNEDNGGYGYAVYLHSYFYETDINATGNYWGAVDSVSIADMIFDKADDPVHLSAYVDFSGWLTSQPLR